jgi:hypothetical protein
LFVRSFLLVFALFVITSYILLNVFIVVNSF